MSTPNSTGERRQSRDLVPMAAILGPTGVMGYVEGPVGTTPDQAAQTTNPEVAAERFTPDMQPGRQVSDPVAVYIAGTLAPHLQ